MPWLVRVSERYRVTRSKTCLLRHLHQECVCPVLGHVDEVVHRCSVHERECRPRDMSSKGTHIDAKGKSAEISLRLFAYLSKRPLIAHVRQLFVSRRLGAAPAVLVVCGGRRVVIAVDSRYRFLLNESNSFIVIPRVADEIAEVIDAVNAFSRDVSQHRLECVEVCVNVGDECVSHSQKLAWSGRLT